MTGPSWPHKGERPRKRRKIENKLTETAQAIQAQNKRLAGDNEQLVAQNEAKDGFIRELKRDMLQFTEILDRRGIKIDGSLMQRTQEHAREVFASGEPSIEVSQGALLTAKQSFVDLGSASSQRSVQSCSLQDSGGIEEQSCFALASTDGLSGPLWTLDRRIDSLLFDPTTWQTSIEEGQAELGS